MKRTGFIILGTLVIAVVVLSYWAAKQMISNADLTSSSAKMSPINPSAPTDGSTPTSRNITSTPDDQKNRAAEVVTEVFNKPISFFGKVQDQYGTPISEAKVEFGAIDRFWEAGSKYETTSNEKGLFSITGISGAGLTVAVSKAGYDGIKGRSYQSFGYGMGPDSNRKTPPTSDAPAIFVLRKKAPPEPLITFRRDFILPKDGTPIEISLSIGKRVNTGTGDLIVQCWTEDDHVDGEGRYAWHARLSVPNGGLLERKDSGLAYEAPEEGYASSLEINMPQASAQWREDSDGEYWLRLGNGRYCRMRCRITTGGEHFATISAFINPSGSRNLEYDSSQRIDAK